MLAAGEKEPNGLCCFSPEDQLHQQEINLAIPAIVAESLLPLQCL